MSMFAPTLPRCAETRPFPSFVLGSEASSTYPIGKRGRLRGLGVGRVRKMRLRAFFSCGRVRGKARIDAPGLGRRYGGRFEHPARLITQFEEVKCDLKNLP